MTLQEVVARFNTTPFLFAGSGITRRYYGLPDWVGLLTYFAGKVKKDPFAYRFYENKASEAEHTAEKLPLVASYVEKDFNGAWFNNEEGIRSDSEKVQADYQKFHDKGKYLAAKLMTIFMEYPIIFVWYSINNQDQRCRLLRWKMVVLTKICLHCRLVWQRQAYMVWQEQ